MAVFATDFDFKNMDRQMETVIQDSGIKGWQAQAMLVINYENEHVLERYPQLETCCPWISEDFVVQGFRGKHGEEILAYGDANAQIPRILLVGGGPRKDISTEKIKKLIGQGMKKCRSLGLKTVLLPFFIWDSLNGGPGYNLKELVYSAHISLYRFTELKTEQKDSLFNPDALIIGMPDKNAAVQAASFILEGENDAKTVAFARDLDNLPPNLLFPETFALRASSMARQVDVKCEILSEATLEAEGFGCMLAVGQGSSHPPRLIVLEYAPDGHEDDPPLVLIGKGLTFDSGGICLKPAANMWQMKCDMSGASAVLSSILQAAREKVPSHIVGLLACAENLPGGKAFRPGDVLNSVQGKSVEVINTDAEGRLVLCDTLGYAQKKWKPDAIVDIATLTGACAVALGSEIGGLFTTSADLGKALTDYGRLSGENLWELPLWAGYEEGLKSPIADIRHTASREGGAITAALFLKDFVEDNMPWAHMDIAGVDFSEKATPLCSEGATGFGARILLQLCRGGWRCS